MKLLLIPDKFKGSLTAKEVVYAISKGVRSIDPAATIDSVLASDGGEGFLNAIAQYSEVIRIQTTTAGPLGRPMQADYLWQDLERTAYVEMAMASGLELLDASERNPLYTSTYGTGLQIKDALDRGARSICLGIGGSATNDGGIGVAAALGYRFLDNNGDEVPHTGEGLGRIVRIIEPERNYDGVQFIAVNDVNNPLYGKEGAAHVYGPQKGADPGVVLQLDTGLRRLEEVVKRDLGKDKALQPGAGAAGGLAYGLSVFFDADFISGTDFILDMAGLDGRLSQDKPDLIITGEGRIDSQSLSGKLIQGVLERGKDHGIPVLGICGMLDIAVSELRSEGFADVIEIRDPGKPLSYNMAHAAELLEHAIRKHFETTS